MLFPFPCSPVIRKCSWKKIHIEKKKEKKKDDEIVKNQIKSRIVERAPKSHIVGEPHYLLHKPVVRDENATTKLRIVFDASAKANESRSLNDCLYPGLSLTATLFGVLLRFRICNITFVGDIEKAFL